MLRCCLYLYQWARTDTADRTNSSEKHGTPYNTSACRFLVLYAEYLMKHEMMGCLFFSVCECAVEYIKWTSRYTCLNCLLILHPAVGERKSWNVFGDPSRALIVGYTLVITHKLSSSISCMATLSDVRQLRNRTVILSVESRGCTRLRNVQPEECR